MKILPEYSRSARSILHFTSAEEKKKSNYEETSPKEMKKLTGSDSVKGHLLSGKYC